MSYEKQNFEDGAVLKAEHLNHMEDGIGTVADAMAELEAVGGELVESVNNHESRIATLEEGGGSSGGDKFYKHKITVSCNKIGTYIYGYLTLEVLSRDSTPITTFDGFYSARQGVVLTEKLTFSLDDAPDYERVVKSCGVGSNNISFTYITAYTVPLATEYTRFYVNDSADYIHIYDVVTEV